MKTKKYNYYLTFTLVFGILFIVFFLLGLLPVFGRQIYGDATITLQVLFLIICVPMATITAFYVKALIDHLVFLKQLRLENSYTLGNITNFYNFEAFKNKATQASHKKSNKKKSRFVIAFSVANLSSSVNASHNGTHVTLNYYISEYLSSLYEDKKGVFSSKNTVYGFNRGIFLIYLCTNEKELITNLVSSITTKVFEIVEEKGLRLWVQPFFGVKELNENDSLVSCVEDAMIARNVSEANFETYTFFNPSFKIEATNQEISELEQALNNNEFVVYYQPKFSVKEKKFVSVEALARWNSPKYGLLNPSLFIEKAEAGGLITLLDNYIFEKALIGLNEALRRGRKVLPVSINFSLYEFYSHHFLDNVVSLLEKYKVPPSLVEIEITETTSQANQFLSISVIKKLKNIGIRVLMDDFGVGFSGIENLRNIPFDAIKIDKSFADLMLTDKKTQSIVKMLIELGHLNDIEVIIEGVDNKEQVDLLKKMKVDTIQGFYYSQPLSESDYEKFLKENFVEKEEKSK